MNKYIVAYDLSVPGQKYECLRKKLEGYGTYWHLQQSVWIIRTSSSAPEVRDALLSCLDQNDKLLVAGLNGEAAWYGYSDQNSRWLKETALA